jgi:hypothetical protein
MLDFDRSFVETFEKTAVELKNRLAKKPRRDKLRNLIKHQGIGKYEKNKKLSPDELEKIVENRGIAGVDGSTNTGGGLYPYVITVQQALAKYSQGNGRDIVLSDAFSPLTQEGAISEEDYRKRVKQNMASLEAQAAIIALKEFKPKVMLIDGSLVRFKIEAPELWEKLKEEAFSVDTLLVGVVEGISTAIISSCLKGELDETLSFALDWELLFGVLEMGEALEMAPGLFKEDFYTCFMRPSQDPKPIGIDLPMEQCRHMKKVRNLIYTLAPADGRGIPIWLDIIDRQVRITDAMVEVLINTYLGEDYARFLLPKRKERPL